MAQLKENDDVNCVGKGTASTETIKVVRFHRRTLVYGAALVSCLSYIVIYVDLVVKTIQLGVLQFATGAVGAFFMIYALVKILRHFGFFKWMNAADQLVIYLMLLTGVFVCSRGLLDRLLPALAYVNYYANPSNQFRNLIFPHLNPALVVGNPHLDPQQSATFGYFNGLSGGRLPWNAWVTPCLTWFLLFVMMLLTLLCLSALLRKEWSDVEKLTFPQTILPLQIFDDEPARALFRNPITWMGVGIPCFIYAVNGLHENFPAVPEIPLQFIDLFGYLKTPPWDQIQATAIFLSFAAVGFAYLLPTELLFSLWFFFVLTRFGDVVGRSLNIDMPGMPLFPTRAYIGYQAAGAYVALTISYFYAGRRLIGSRLKRAFRFQKCDGDDEEILPQMTALWGMIASYLGIVAWCVWAGMSAWFAAAVFAIYLAITCVVLSRGVAEAGLLITETSFRPGDIVAMFVHPSSWSSGDLVGVSMLNTVFFRDMRGLFLGLFLDAQQMAGGVKMRRSSLLAPMAVGLVTALVVGTASHLHLAYEHGAASLYSYGVSNSGINYSEAASILSNNTVSFPSAPYWFMVGMVVASSLAKLRSMFVGFPLVPIAYAVAPSWGLYVLWFPCLLMWVVKSLIIRYGNIKLYRAAQPFFLGLIIGEVSSIALWALLAAVFKVTPPALPLP